MSTDGPHPAFGTPLHRRQMERGLSREIDQRVDIPRTVRVRPLSIRSLNREGCRRRGEVLFHGVGDLLQLGGWEGGHQEEADAAALERQEVYLASGNTALLRRSGTQALEQGEDPVAVRVAQVDHGAPADLKLVR